MHVSMCVHTCCKWGIPMVRGGATYYLSVIAFADNYWFFVASPKELHIMLTTWFDLLDGYGWHTPLGELSYCSTDLTTQFAAPIVYQGREPDGDRISR